MAERDLEQAWTTQIRLVESNRVTLFEGYYRCVQDVSF